MTETTKTTTLSEIMEIVLTHPKVMEQLVSKTPKFKIGDRVKCPDSDRVYMINDLSLIDKEEPIAFFEGGGFWRLSKLVRAK